MIGKDFNNFRVESHEKLSLCRDRLKNIFFENAENYFLIYAITNEILEAYYASHDSESEDILDIGNLAEAFGFSVKRDHLNIGRQRNLGLILGRLEENKDTRSIYLEFEDIITEQQERYTIAYLLGYYFMQKNIERNFVAECVEVRIPQTSREFNASLFAAFLLLQPKKFFKEVEKYIRRTERPINQETFLLEMSKWAKVPYHFTIVSYEYLKVFAGLYHNEAFKKQWIAKLDEYPKEQKILEKAWKEEKLLPDEFFY